MKPSTEASLEQAAAAPAAGASASKKQESLIICDHLQRDEGAAKASIFIALAAMDSFVKQLTAKDLITRDALSVVYEEGQSWYRKCAAEIEKETSFPFEAMLQAIEGFTPIQRLTQLDVIQRAAGGLKQATAEEGAIVGAILFTGELTGKPKIYGMAVQNAGSKTHYHVVDLYREEAPLVYQKFEGFVNFCKAFPARYRIQIFKPIAPQTEASPL